VSRLVFSPARNWSGFALLVTAVALFMFALSYPAPILTTSSRNVCIGLGGWACGYTGPFSGDYYTGYATVGCTPLNPNSTCVVPQIAIETSYLVISNASYVIDWANESLQWSSRFADGSTVSVSGTLDAIFYNKTAGSTYMIYYSNSKGLWTPQPRLQIENATLTTHSVQSVTLTCTTTLSFTVSGPQNGVWNLPMIPAGTCYTVNDMTQQSHTTGNTDIQFWPMVLASSGGAVTVAGTLVFWRNRRKETTQSPASEYCAAHTEKE